MQPSELNRTSPSDGSVMRHFGDAGTSGGVHGNAPSKVQPPSSGTLMRNPHQLQQLATDSSALGSVPMSSATMRTPDGQSALRLTLVAHCDAMRTLATGRSVLACAG